MSVVAKPKTELLDAELVLSSMEGDKEAFDVLVKRHQRPVYAAAFAVLSDSEAARDVLQDTFLAAYCTLDRLENPHKFGAWVYAIARNRARGYYRSRRRRHSVEVPLDALELAHMVDRCEKTEAVRHALSTLTELQAHTVTLYYMEGYSVSECAALLETSVGNIKRRLYDARQRLKKEMTSMIRKTLPEFALPRDYKIDINTSQRVCTTQSMLEDLSARTGIVFDAGKDDFDWAVRGRKINVVANGVLLIDLMESIANVLNCEWNEIPGDPLTYRLYMDEETRRKAREARDKAQAHFDAEITRRRQEFVDRITNWQDVSEEELARLKVENPCRYLFHVRGSAYMYQRMFDETPGLADSLIHKKRNMAVKVQDLSKETIDLIRHVIYERFKYRGYHGSRDGNPFPEEYDIDCPEAYLWFELVPREFIWDINQHWDLGGVGVFVRDRFFYVEDMLVEENARSNYRANMQIRALETGKTYHEVQDATEDEHNRAKVEGIKDLERCYGISPLTGEGEDDPELSRKIRVNFTGDTLKDYQAALAEAGGLAVVSDIYFARRDTVPIVEEGEVELRELLDTIAGVYDYRWTKRGQVIEFQDKKWFFRTGSQIPFDQVETLRKNLVDRGYVSLNDYADIAALSNEQIEESLMPDEIFCSTGMFNWLLFESRYILRLYRLLDEGQRKAIFSAEGLDMRTLTDEQSKQVTQMCDHLDEHNVFPQIEEIRRSTDRWLVLYATFEIDEGTGAHDYKFYIRPNDGENLRRWWVRLPRLMKQA